MEIALTGQESIASWQLQSPQSSDITWDFPSSILNTPGHNDSQVPQPIQSSSFTFGLAIFVLLFNN